MSGYHHLALAAGHGQNWRQVGELLLAFALSSVVGLERQLRGKQAGLRTQAIVGTTAALVLLVSKYGFADVLVTGQVVLDPSRVAAQIVSGIGFLGAGLIITRRGAVRGLTTAAAVWETAAIGMAAGAGLPLLAVVVTVLHFVIVLGFTELTRHIPGRSASDTAFSLLYEDGRGVLRRVLSSCGERGWSISRLTVERAGAVAEATSPSTDPDLIGVTLALSGPGSEQAATVLGSVDGVTRVERLPDDGD